MMTNTAVDPVNSLRDDGARLELHQPPDQQRHPYRGFHLHVIPRFKDQPGKDAIGLPWDSVSGNLDEIERIGNHLS